MKPYSDGSSSFIPDVVIQHFHQLTAKEKVGYYRLISFFGQDTTKVTFNPEDLKTLFRASTSAVSKILSTLEANSLISASKTVNQWNGGIQWEVALTDIDAIPDEIIYQNCLPNCGNEDIDYVSE